MAYVYILQSNALPCAHKIGQSDTTQTLKWRITKMHHANPLGVTKRGHIWQVTQQAAYELEQNLHTLFEVRRLNGEWFLLYPEEVNAILSIKTDIDFEQLRETLDVEPFSLDDLPYLLNRGDIDAQEASALM